MAYLIPIGAGAVRQKVLDHAALGSVLALMVADLLRLNGGALSAVTPCRAAARAVQWAFGKPWKTLRTRQVRESRAAYAWIRVGLPLAAPARPMQTVVGSAALWSAGFGRFTLRYWPGLSRARLDGQVG